MKGIPHKMSKLSYYAAAFNLLGMCYLFPPDDDINKTAIRFFKTGDFATQWPCKINSQLCEDIIKAASADMNQLKKQWQHLFIEINNLLPALPNNTLYLKLEDIPQSELTCRLIEYLKCEQFKSKDDFPNSIESIGLVLFQVATLASKKREDAVNKLLTHYLNTWLPHYLNSVKMSGYSQFYSLLTELVTITVNAFRK